MGFLNKYKADILVIVLIVVAVILGFFIYKNSATISTTTPNGSQSQNQSRSERPTRERRPTPAGLTADEKLAMNPPTQDATDVQIKEYLSLLNKVAVSSNTLDLNKCDKPNPLILKLKLDQDFQVKNSDSVAHTIRFRSGKEFAVDAGETKSIKANFGNGTGYYGYLCDKLAGLVGVFLVTD